MKIRTKFGKVELWTALWPFRGGCACLSYVDSTLQATRHSRIDQKSE